MAVVGLLQAEVKVFGWSDGVVFGKRLRKKSRQHTRNTLSYYNHSE
jgi:hypothetical protein